MTYLTRVCPEDRLAGVQSVEAPGPRGLDPGHVSTDRGRQSLRRAMSNQRFWGPALAVVCSEKRGSWTRHVLWRGH